MYVMPDLMRYLREQIPSRGPFRVMAAGVLVTTLGEGAWYTSWAIYFTTVAGLSAAAVGTGLLVAGGIGLSVATPLGSLADRLGPRNILIALVIVDGLSMGAFALVHTFWPFLLVSVLNTGADRSSSGVKTTYVAELAPRRTRLAELARQRVASHVGYTVGAAGGAICLAVGTPTAFRILIALNAATSLVYAGLLTRVPTVKGRPRRTRHGVYTDWAFLSVMACTGVLSLCWGIVSIGVPLWIIRHTHLPVALAAVVVIINSAGVATLQVVSSRGSTTVRGAAYRAVASGAALAVACVLLALTAGGSGAVPILLVVVAAGAHLTGELLFIAATWGLTLGLTPAGSTGQYQGAAATVQAATLMISPVAMTLLVAGWGRPGWLALAALFLTAGLATLPAARWAARSS
jgi:MFS family permease